MRFYRQKQRTPVQTTLNVFGVLAAIALVLLVFVGYVFNIQLLIEIWDQPVTGFFLLRVIGALPPFGLLGAILGWIPN